MLSLGPIHIPIQWVILFIGVFVSYGWVKFFYREIPHNSPDVPTIFLYSILIWITIYKTSIVILKPHLIWTNPLGLLYFTGGDRGFVLATIATIGYIGFQILKKKEAWIPSILLLGSGFTIWGCTYFLGATIWRVL
jgi:hypothetical protein